MQPGRKAGQKRTERGLLKSRGLLAERRWNVEGATEARRSSPVHLSIPKFCLGQALAPGEERKLFAKLLFDPTTLPSSRF